MIEIGNHLGTITVSKKYLVSLVAAKVQNCFGITRLVRTDAKLSDGAVVIKISAVFSPDVNIPAVADAVSHKVAYELIDKTGIDVRSVEIFADEIV